MFFRSKKPSTLQEALQGRLDFRERSIQQAAACDQDQVTSRRYVGQKSLDSRSQATFGPIPLYSATQRTPND